MPVENVIAIQSMTNTDTADISATVNQVSALFAALDNGLGAPDLVVYNPSYRQRAPFIELDPDDVYKALMISCYGGFLVGQEAAKRMLVVGQGSILFTGASASVKGYKNSAPFAMGKFGLRGLAQSMAREDTLGQRARLSQDFCTRRQYELRLRAAASRTSRRYGSATVRTSSRSAW